MFEKINIEHIFLNMFFSGLICLVMYLFTAVVVFYSDGLLLHQELFGVVALLLYYIVPFVTIYLLFFEKDKNVK